MELTIDREAIEIIYRYMDREKPKTTGLERICINKMRDMANGFIMRNSLKSMLVLKGETQIQDIYEEKYKTYFQGSSWYWHSWLSGRQKWGLTYFLHGKCERYF